MTDFAGRLNLGATYGGGYNNATSAYSSNGTGVKIASRTKISSMEKDMSAGHKKNIDMIDAYLKCGKVLTAIELYEQMCDEVGISVDNYGYELSDSERESISAGAYENRMGSSFEMSLAENTHSSFVTGLLEGIPIVGLFVNSTSQDEALAMYSKTDIDAKDKVKEGAGALISGLATGAAAGAAIGTFGGPIGWLGGAIIGGTCGVIRTFFN